VNKELKASTLRELTTEELKKKVAAYKEELFNLRFQHSMGQLENTSRIKQVRKCIARCKTILRERELSLEGGNTFERTKA